MSFPPSSSLYGDNWLTLCIRLRCTHLIAGVLGRAGQIGQKKRAEAAKNGKVAWETAGYLTEWFQEEAELQAEAKERSMGRSTERQ